MFTFTHILTTGIRFLFKQYSIQINWTRFGNRSVFNDLTTRFQIYHRLKTIRLSFKKKVKLVFNPNQTIIDVLLLHRVFCIQGLFRSYRKSWKRWTEEKKSLKLLSYQQKVSMLPIDALCFNRKYLPSDICFFLA